jgi:hypothetical protein
MKLSNFLEGVELLRFYYDNPDGYHLEAEHDEIHMHATDKTLPPESVQKLHDLGWWQRTAEYDADEGWGAFT